MSGISCHYYFITLFHYIGEKTEISKTRTKTVEMEKAQQVRGKIRIFYFDHLWKHTCKCACKHTRLYTVVDSTVLQRPCCQSDDCLSVQINRYWVHDSWYVLRAFVVLLKHRFTSLKPWWKPVKQQHTNDIFEWQTPCAQLALDQRYNMKSYLSL